MSEVFCGTTQVSNKAFSISNADNLALKVFKIQLSSYYSLVPELRSFLDSSELLRADKFHFTKDKNQFIICRAFLKMLLAQHTGLHISEVHIETDINKKPYFNSQPKVHFNLSHAEDMAVIAIHDKDVGIDIEYMNRTFDFTEVLSYTMNSTETQMLFNSKNNIHTFYTFWTRKEAIVKAIGTGISDDLLKIPATDGQHDVDSNLIAGYKELNVLSFDLSEDYVVSIALNDLTQNFKELTVYDLRGTLKEML